MSLYQAVPYSLYPGCDQGTNIVLDQVALTFTEMNERYLEILKYFVGKSRTRAAVVRELGDDDVELIIDDLIEMGLLVERLPPQPRQEFPLRPHVRAFRIALTTKCNLRCAECFVTKNADSLSHMDDAVLEKVIKETLRYGASERIVYHFFGGEPLLRFDHIERAVKIIEDAVLIGKMVRPLYTITTNAMLVTDEIITFFKQHDFKVGVSVDGPEAINDRLRIQVDGKGSFRLVKQNYMKMVEAGIDCHVLITPYPSLLAELPTIFRAVLQEFPMKTVTVNTPLHYDHVGWTVPGKKYASTLFELLRIAKDFGVSVDSAASPPLAALAHHIVREGPCALECDTVMASVGVDGTMSYCAQKWHPRITVPMSEETRLSTPIRRATDCITCPALGICGGPCPAHQEIAGGELDGNKCDFMLALLELVPKNLDLFEVVAEPQN